MDRRIVNYLNVTCSIGVRGDIRLRGPSETYGLVGGMPFNVPFAIAKKTNMKDRPIRFMETFV